MSIKERLRQLLPPTNRNFSNQISQLEEHLTSLQLKMEASEKTNRQEAISLYDRLGRMDEKFSEFYKSYNALDYSSSEYNQHSYTKRTILLAGWYGADNLGDELMLQTIIEHLPEDLLPHTAVLLWDWNQYDPLKIDPRIQILHYPKNIWQIDTLAESFNTIIWGGGAILDDEQFTTDPFNYNTGNLFIRINRLMIARNKKVYCLGLSTNFELINPEYINLLQQIIDDSIVFSIRDSNSIETLKRSGINTSKVQLCEDIVFANTELLHAKTNTKILDRADLDIFTIGLVVLNSNHMSEYYLRLINRLSTVLNDKKVDFRIQLILYSAWDNYFCESIIEHSDFPEKIQVMPYTESSINSPLNNCDVNICFKYHAALMSSVLGLKTLIVYTESHPHYKNKMEHVSALFSTSENLFSDKELESLTDEALYETVMTCKEPKDREDVLLLESKRLSSILEEIK